VPVSESFVPGILLKIIDAQSSMLNDGADQIEAGILIPSGPFVKICIGEKGHSEDQESTYSNPGTVALCGNIHRG
jgi:hypothetical protein